MVRYIDAELLESKYREGTDPQDPYSEIAYLLPEDIESIPTADVEPVRHGRWKWLTKKEAEPYAPFGMVFSTENWICSECNNYKTFGIGMQPKYCDNCGAKMDGDTDA